MKSMMLFIAKSAVINLRKRMSAKTTMLRGLRINRFFAIRALAGY